LRLRRLRRADAVCAAARGPRPPARAQRGRGRGRGRRVPLRPGGLSPRPIARRARLSEAGSFFLRLSLFRAQSLLFVQGGGGGEGVDGGADARARAGARADCEAGHARGAARGAGCTCASGACRPRLLFPPRYKPDAHLSFAQKEPDAHLSFAQKEPDAHLSPPAPRASARACSRATAPAAAPQHSIYAAPPLSPPPLAA
jgi:hypothetical protein